MSRTAKPSSRIKIDDRLKDVDWNVLGSSSALSEHPLPHVLLSRIVRSDL